MEREQLPSLNKDEYGKDIPAHWAGERERGPEDKPGESKGASPEARKELYNLAHQLVDRSVIASPPKPPKEGPDTYLG